MLPFFYPRDQPYPASQSAYTASHKQAAPAGSIPSSTAFPLSSNFYHSSQSSSSVASTCPLHQGPDCRSPLHLTRIVVSLPHPTLLRVVCCLLLCICLMLQPSSNNGNKSPCTEHPPHTKVCAKHLIYIISFNPYNYPNGQGLFFPIHHPGNLVRGEGTCPRVHSM